MSKKLHGKKESLKSSLWCELIDNCPEEANLCLDPMYDDGVRAKNECHSSYPSNSTSASSPKSSASSSCGTSETVLDSYRSECSPIFPPWTYSILPVSTNIEIANLHVDLSFGSRAVVP